MSQTERKVVLQERKELDVNGRTVHDVIGQLQALPPTWQTGAYLVVSVTETDHEGSYFDVAAVLRRVETDEEYEARVTAHEKTEADERAEYRRLQQKFGIPVALPAPALVENHYEDGVTARYTTVEDADEAARAYMKSTGRVRVQVTEYVRADRVRSATEHARVPR